MKIYKATSVFVLLSSILVVSCTRDKSDSGSVDASVSAVPRDDPSRLLAPIAPLDRDPTPDRINKANTSPPAPAQGVFEEYDKLRASYTIPADPLLALTNTRQAAIAFGATLRGAIQDPEPSASNVRIPGYSKIVSFPASINFLGRSAMYQRPGVVGVDVGPSKPDINSKVWVAIFQGVSGPIGNVVSACVAVVVFAEYDSIHFEIVEIPSRLTKQPSTVTDSTTVLCELDLLNPPSEDYVYKY